MIEQMKKDPSPAKATSLNTNIIQIELTQGKYAIVDKEDFERVSSIKWCFNKSGYAIAHKKGSGKKGQNISMHRFIMNTPKGMDTDHINGNGLDNRKENLRICTHQENIQNQQIQNINKSSIYKGVSFRKDIKKWSTKLQVKNRQIVIGVFPTERSAAMAYDIWAKDLFGSFAKLNFERII